MARFEDEVLITLERVALDFTETGEAQIVSLDVRTGETNFTFRVRGRKSCGRMTASPDGALLALSCSGAVDPQGEVERISESALLLFDARRRPLEVVATFEAEDLASAPIQSGVTFFDETTLLLKTQSSLGGASNNRLLSLDIETGEVRELLEAKSAPNGTGRGLVFGDVFCAPGCSSDCLMADAEQGRLQIISRRSGQLEVTGSRAVERRVGLPPVRLSGRSL
jgi:outer membrane protein assembly factor BamB